LWNSALSKPPQSSAGHVERRASLEIRKSLERRGSMPPTMATDRNSKDNGKTSEKTRRGSIDGKKKGGGDLFASMMNPVATHAGASNRSSIDAGAKVPRRGSIDGKAPRRGSIDGKKKGGGDLFASMMNPVATHAAGGAKKSVDGGNRRERRSSFVEQKCAMCKVETPANGEKLCRLCK
jgi:hypothetical protein